MAVVRPKDGLMQMLLLKEVARIITMSATTFVVHVVELAYPQPLTQVVPLVHGLPITIHRALNVHIVVATRGIITTDAHHAMCQDINLKALI